MHKVPERDDVAVIGGGIMGSSVAYFLKLLAPSIAVCVIEPDPAYAFCSKPRASYGAPMRVSRLPQPERS